MSDLFVASSFGEMTCWFNVRFPPHSFDVSMMSPGFGGAFVDLNWSLGWLGTEKYKFIFNC